VEKTHRRVLYSPDCYGQLLPEGIKKAAAQKNMPAPVVPQAQVK